MSALDLCCTADFSSKNYVCMLSLLLIVLFLATTFLLLMVLDGSRSCLLHKRYPVSLLHQGDFGLLAHKHSRGRVNTSQEGWGGKAPLEIVPAPLLTQRSISHQILSISKERDSAASLGNLCWRSFTSEIIESILMQLSNLSKIDKTEHVTYAYISLFTSCIWKKKGRKIRKSMLTLAEKQQY